ncbi:MAG: PorT family protein [Flavobacteriales bacterium]|nr:PorT family protein [Flavobacteriales bacterium]
MKTTATITLILSLLVSVTFAQNDSVTTQGSDTGDVEVVISPKKGQDSTIVNVAGMKIIVLSNNDKGSDRIIVDGEEVDTEDWEDEDEDKKDDPVSHWAGIRVGVNGFLHNDGLWIPSADQNMELDYGRSVSWDLNLIEKDFKLYKQYIELVTGLGLHFANYTFNSQYTTLRPTVPFSYNTDSTRLFDKNKLKATYLTAPLMIGFSTHKKEEKAFRFAAGGQVSWRMGSRLKQRYSENGDNNTLKYKSDFDLNPFLFHATASIGYGPVNVYANYGLNSLFQNGRTSGELRPFDMGVQLMF